MRIVTESCFRCFQVSSLPVSWIGKERDNASIVSEVSGPWNFLGERTLSSQRIGLRSERRSHDRRGIDTLASVTFRGCDLPSSFSRGVQWSRVPPWRGITPVGNRFTTRRKGHSILSRDVFAERLFNWWRNFFYFFIYHLDDLVNLFIILKRKEKVEKIFEDTFIPLLLKKSNRLIEILKFNMDIWISFKLKLCESEEEEKSSTDHRR